jgi:hypothetical protein
MERVQITRCHHCYIYMITVCDAAASARAATESCDVLRILEDSRVEPAVKVFREKLTVLRGKPLFKRKLARRFSNRH